jgi:hypothetical protein
MSDPALPPAASSTVFVTARLRCRRWMPEHFDSLYAVYSVAPDNLASQRVLAKAGMTLAKRRSNDDGSLTCVYEWVAPGGT